MTWLDKEVRSAMTWLHKQKMKEVDIVLCVIIIVLSTVLIFLICYVYCCKKKMSYNEKKTTTLYDLYDRHWEVTGPFDVKKSEKKKKKKTKMPVTDWIESDSEDGGGKPPARHIYFI
eukprot:76161_1